MDEYYVNKSAQAGKHQIHVIGCLHFPNAKDAKYIGDFLTCHEAIEEAQIYYHQVDACHWCCRACQNL